MDLRPTREWREAAGRGRVEVGELARIMDHTILKAQATPADIEVLCDEAVRYGFGAVCVNSAHVPQAAARVREAVSSRARTAADRLEAGVRVCAVVGFPLGAMATEAKAFEAAWAVEHGADEIDMVIPIGHLKAAAAVEDDIRAVVTAARRSGQKQGGGERGRGGQGDGERGGSRPLVKVIIETCYLTDEEKVEACRRAAAAGADFVKTSTGFGTAGAAAADVALMRRTVGEELGVKASGGIRDLETALAMIAAGADRLGLSAGVAVVEEARARQVGEGGTG